MKNSIALFCLLVGVAAANAAEMNTTECHACLEDEFGNCDKMEMTNCTNPTTDSCFSAAGTYTFTNGTSGTFKGVARGCIACPNETQGCANFKTHFDKVFNWTLGLCDIICCKGDNCNENTTLDHPTTAPPSTTPMSTTTMAATPTTMGAICHFPFAVVLAIAAIVGALFVN